MKLDLTLDPVISIKSAPTEGNKIKEDVSEWGENELFQCNINNIRETKEFSDQLEHIKKMFNKK